MNCKEKICNTCGCWNRQSPEGVDGECRAAPPVVGWPQTKAMDWCVTGWISDPRQDSSPALVPNNRDLGQLGLNYAYIRDYAEDACTWLECVMEEPNKIPVALRHVLANPLGNIVTEPLPALDDCDDILKWALSEPGGDNPAVGDESGILCYLDAPEDRARNEAILVSLGDDHPWVAFCAQLQSN